jgi:hypothetical protein
MIRGTAHCRTVTARLIDDRSYMSPRRNNGCGTLPTRRIAWSPPRLPIMRMPIRSCTHCRVRFDDRLGKNLGQRQNDGGRRQK